MGEVGEVVGSGKKLACELCIWHRFLSLELLSEVQMEILLVLD